VADENPGDFVDDKSPWSRTTLFCYQCRVISTDAPQYETGRTQEAGDPTCGAGHLCEYGRLLGALPAPAKARVPRPEEQPILTVREVAGSVFAEVRRHGRPIRLEDALGLSRVDLVTTVDGRPDARRKL
jgi:hypothetical protein